MTIHHLNCGTIIVPGYPKVTCHCLLLETEDCLVLVDTGLGIKDVNDPIGRLGRELIESTGFQFNAEQTAYSQIIKLKLESKKLRHIILSHADPDHTGGLADFPEATVHITKEEYENLSKGNSRYLASHFAHGVNFKIHQPASETWFGIPSRSIELGIDLTIKLIPLFGHTMGHSGVAIKAGNESWLLYVGDAYYLRDELTVFDHPVTGLVQSRAEHNEQRMISLNQLKRLQREHARQISMFCYHDITEFDLTLN